MIYSRSGIYHISIGDDGVVALYYIFNAVRSRLFISNHPSAEELKKLDELLAQDTGAAIRIYLDHSDQIYIHRTFPGVSSFAINNVVAKKLESEFPDDAFKAAIKIGREKSVRKDWIFTMFSSPLNTNTERWLEYFYERENMVIGIHMLPIETSYVVAKLTDKSKLVAPFKRFGNLRGSASHSWVIFISNHKAGGIRQSIFCDGEVCFSRLVYITASSHAEFSDKIENEIKELVEQVHRFSFSHGETVCVYTVFAEDILENIKEKKIHGVKLYTITPTQLAHKLGVSYSVGKDDKFSDPVILAYLARERKYNTTVHTRDTRITYWYMYGARKIKYTMLVMIPLLILYSIFQLYELSSIIYHSKAIKPETVNIKQQLSKQKVVLNQLNVAEGDINKDMMIAISDYHSLLSNLSVNPVELLLPLEEIVEDNVAIRRLKYMTNRKLYQRDAKYKNISEAIKHSKGRVDHLRFSIHVYPRDFSAIDADVANEKIRRYNDIDKLYEDKLLRIFPGSKISVEGAGKNPEGVYTLDVTMKQEIK